MPVSRPTFEQLAELADRVGLELSSAELEEFVDLVDEALTSHDWIVAVGEMPADRTLARRGGYRPSADENVLGAWYWKASISDRADGGLLDGKSVVVKDNICVAGLPMMNGSVLLEGYVPEQDATVVQRVLRAGAMVVGKAVCESLCYSGGSHTSDTGPVRNPYDLSRSSGGSSSGCAALVANGEVDLAIGGDQGGSIRGPSSWSGVYGLKPTYGLVPYTGAFPLEMTLDHLGPMARTTADVAVLLDVLAGPDGLDPRQNVAVEPRTMPYRESIAAGIKGVRVGILDEAFGWEGSEPDVDALVASAIGELSTLGADVRPVSVPWHRHGGKVTLGIAAEGSTALLIHGEGTGTNWRGLYVTSMLEAFARGRRTHRDKVPPMLKLQALVGQWLHESYHGRCYAQAQNVARRLASMYDDVLATVDVLAMPTTPLKATPLPQTLLSTGESTRIAHQMGANTSPFNVTGHPAMSIPCALSEGLPVGLMIVGRRGEDDVVLRVAHAYETGVFHPPPLAASPPDRVREGAV
jgi:amidase